MEAAIKNIIVLILGMSVIASTAAAQSLPWRYYTDTNRLTDEPYYYAVTSITDYDTLIVGCTAKAFWVAAILGVLDIRFGDYREVVWRVDREPAVYQKWHNQEKGGAMLEGHEAIMMARAIRDATDRIIVKSGAQTAQFTARGSTETINQVFENCKNPAPAR